jgi:hypothetical protein
MSQNSAAGRLLRSSSSSSNYTNKQIHQRLEEGLLHNNSSSKAAASGGSSNNNTMQAAQQQQQRYRQAVLNGVCSFLVVLLAAQSFKSGRGRRSAELHLEAAKEVLAETQAKVKHIAGDEFIDALARACCVAASIEANSESDQPKASGWRYWLTGGHARKEKKKQGSHGTVAEDDEDEEGSALKDRIRAVLREHLQSSIGDAGLNEAERDHKMVADLADATTKSAAPHGSTAAAEEEEDEGTIARHLLGQLTNDEDDDDVVAVESTTNENGVAVVKKRVFTM